MRGRACLTSQRRPHGEYGLHSERHGTRSGERGGQLGENREVGAEDEVGGGAGPAFH